jgi:hypothetical protein
MQSPIQEQLWKEWEDAYLQIIDRCLSMGKLMEENLTAADAGQPASLLSQAIMEWANGQLNTLYHLQQRIEAAGLAMQVPVLFQQFALLFLALLQETGKNNVTKEQNGTKFMVYSVPSMLESIKALKGLEVFFEEEQDKVKAMWQEVRQYIRAFYGNEK